MNLFVGVSELPFVGPASVAKLEKLGIVTVWDLFHHIPRKFLDFSKAIPIGELQIGDIATVSGTITKFVNQYTRKGKPMQILTVEDKTGKVDAMWFNQPYLSRTFHEGDRVALGGKLDWMGRKRALIAPEYEIVKADGKQIHTKGLISIYPETAGISSKWLRRRIFDAWEKYGGTIEDNLPEKILLENGLITLRDAIHGVHFPKSMEEFEKAKHRLAFDELLSLHIKNIKSKKVWNKHKATKIKNNKLKVTEFINGLPFELTGSQKQVVDEILIDLEKDVPMNRLLEGDVGSGKTVVAAIATYAVFLSGKKTVFMAPTLVLANQHFKTLKELFKSEKVKIGLSTSAQKNKSDFDILVGTHAVLNDKLSFKDVSLVIIDEQHKFGVDQRRKLELMSSSAGRGAHVLNMTATPIPRTVALTFFGDMELSVLKELPGGRQKITTWIVPDEKRKGGYGWIKSQITNTKSQIFIVCPLIEDSESETLKDVRAVKSEFEKISKEFKDFRVGLLHGKLKNVEKEKVIADFKDGKTDILVTTPVVEVGIDVPNATMMVIEAADRFGLASLHQLRGRVGRGSKKSYCLLMTENNSEKTQMRLSALKENTSGFELAEIDLKMRGPGEIFGTRQSGIPELRIADWSDVELIKHTKRVADLLLGDFRLK